MMESPYRIRPANLADADRLRKDVKATMANPEGRAVRKSYSNSAQANELLLLERFDNKERTWTVVAFVEFHTRIDGSMTIRDAGSVGDEPHIAIVKRLMREMLRHQNPTSATVKLRADQPLWNGMFEELPGFRQEGKEFSRPHWRNIWVWTREAEQAIPRARAAAKQPPKR